VLTDRRDDLDYRWKIAVRWVHAHWPLIPHEEAEDFASWYVELCLTQPKHMEKAFFLGNRWQDFRRSKSNRNETREFDFVPLDELLANQAFEPSYFTEPTDKFEVYIRDIEFSPQEEEVLGYYFFRGLSSHEIGERLGLSHPTIGSRLKSALAKIRQSFIERGITL
jgi:RNA polymerase sigma factor (sigma-70 family)